MPPDFDRLESFGHDELNAKYCYFRCSRPPNVDGIKILIEMTRPQNTVFKPGAHRPQAGARLVS